MRLLHLSIGMVVWASAQSCSPPCDLEALPADRRAQLEEAEPEAAIQSLLEVCSLPPSLAFWLESKEELPPAAMTELWTLTCPGQPAVTSVQPTLSSRRALHRSCTFNTDFASEEEFARASGHPLLAAAVVQWLSEQEVPSEWSHSVGRAILGDPVLATDHADLPTWPGETEDLVTPPMLTVTAEQASLGDTVLVRVEDLTRTRRAEERPLLLPGVRDALGSQDGNITSLLISPDAPLHFVRQVMGSLPDPAKPLSWVVTRQVAGQDDWMGSVPVRISSSATAVRLRETPQGWDVWAGDAHWPPIPDCPAKGLTVCHPERDAARSALSNVISSIQAERPELTEISLDLQPDTPAQEVLDALHWWHTAGGQSAETVALDPGFSPCWEAIEGMTCIPGGPFLAAPEQTAVTLPTFFLDSKRVTAEEYATCQQARACIRRRSSPASESDPSQVNVSFVEAERYCTWAGKRLPTEWEWQAGARSQGLEGELAEWTATWFSRSADACGETCIGFDPRGPCDGAPQCRRASKRTARGGSGEAEEAVSARAARSAGFRSRSLGFRCASSRPLLTRFPPRHLTHPPPVPPDPTPLSEEQRRLVSAIHHDAIEDKPACTDRVKSSGLHCKDPAHYIRTNEPRIHILYPYVRNRGGGYVGVGSDQAYNFIAVARSQFAWLMDYDIAVLRVHWFNRVLMMHSETPDAFLARFDASAVKESRALLAKEYADHPEGDKIVGAYTWYRSSLQRHYTKHRQPSDKTTDGWLRNPEQYAYVRKLWLQGRMEVVKGDMLGEHGMVSIGQSATELGIPIRVYYTSNAPNAWGGKMTSAYKRNVRSLPMDDESIVLQTLGVPTGYGQTGYWHHNVTHGPLHQDWLGRAGFDHLYKVTHLRGPTDDVDLTIMGLPSD